MQQSNTPRDRRLLSATLDVLIAPRPELKLEGAGRAAVVDYVEAKLAATPDVAGLVDAGLSALQSQAASDHDGRGFVQLGTDAQIAIMRAVESQQPFFIPILLLHAYPGYYQQPDVLQAIGYPARPPFPEGYEIDVDDGALLSKIQARARG